MLGRETAPGRVVSRPDLAPDLHMGVQDATAPSSGISRTEDSLR